MSRIPRRLRQGAALTVAVGVLGSTALLAAQVMAARLRRYATVSLGLAVRSTVGSVKKPALRMTILGDAAALGVGVHEVGDTLGGQLAELLATDGRTVDLSFVAVAGSRSEDLSAQVARALLGPRPDVAVILIGAGDASRLRLPALAAAYLGEAVRRLREAGVEVVVGTCPDLGAVRAFAPPLRYLMGWRGQQLARAQAASVHAAGGDVVDLAAETGPVFRADAGALCHDGFHPSADGYRLWAHALYPAVAAAAYPRTFPG